MLLASISLVHPVKISGNHAEPLQAKTAILLQVKKSDFRSICLHINQLCPPVPLPIEDACSMALEVIRLEQCDLRILILIV